MVILHGFSFSNYYNIVKHVLLHKGVEFEEDLVFSGTPELKELNPLGKVPVLTTEDGSILSESSVLLEYLEDRYPQPPLLPAEPEERARVRRLVKMAELYFELPSRRLLPALFASAPVSDRLKNEVVETLERGVEGLKAYASFTPYVAGDELTLADIYLRYSVAIAMAVGPQFLDWNPVERVSDLGEWEALMANLEISRQIDADKEANAAPFMAHIKARQA